MVIFWTKKFYVELEQKIELETFDHGTFLYKVHELLLITLHSVTSKTLLNEDALFIFSEIFLRDTKFMHYCQVFDYLQWVVICGHLNFSY